jgi:hypothetical protein
MWRLYSYGNYVLLSLIWIEEMNQTMSVGYCLHEKHYEALLTRCPRWTFLTDHHQVDYQ